MRQNTLLSIVAVAVAMAGIACGSSSPSSPTAPSQPSTGTVTAVNVSSASPTGTTFQLTATAVMTDGTTKDVTSSATWDSSNTGVAVVAAGVVTVKGTGAVDFTATYVKVSGSIHLLVSPQPPTGVSVLVGAVRGVAPSNNPISGATVQIIAGPDTGKAATTGSDGMYRFDGLTNARLSLHITADGYQDWAVGNLALNDTVQTQDAFLYPEPPKDTSGAWPTARCNDGSWTWDSDTTSGCSTHSGVAYTLAAGTDKPSSVRR